MRNLPQNSRDIFYYQKITSPKGRGRYSDKTIIGVSYQFK